MPTYTYQCDDHEEHPTFIQVHSITVTGTDQEPKYPCPECGGSTHRIPQLPLATGRSPVDALYEFAQRKREEVYKDGQRRKRLAKQRKLAAARKNAARKQRILRLKEQ